MENCAAGRQPAGMMWKRYSVWRCSEPGGNIERIINMVITSSEIARMIDLSAVRAQDDDDYIHKLVLCAKKYRVIAVIPLPSRIPLVRDLLDNDPNVLFGGAVGFPSGGTSTASKAAEADEQIAQGCQELEMVINIGKLISGRYAEALDDIRAVIDHAQGYPVKVILECHYLSDDLIRRGCDICMEAGAAWIKTGTGWAPTGATLYNVRLIRAHVGDQIGIKAAGGVRDLNTLLGLYCRGARRFGLGLHSGEKILQDAFALPEGKIDLAQFGN
jgi:deoxyribose-phosphate aldolase